MQASTTAPAPAGEQFISAKDVAKMLQVTHRWIVEKTASGHIPSRRLPGSNRYRYLASEVRQAMEQGKL